MLNTSIFILSCFYHFFLYLVLILPINSIKPTLKKVSKYENKFAKLQKKAAEFNFRNQLKTVKKKEFELEDDKKEVSNLSADELVRLFK